MLSSNSRDFSFQVRNELSSAVSRIFTFWIHCCRESGSPTLEQVLMMGCQRGHDGQGASPTESDLSMLSSSGISSVESSLTELMVKLIVADV